MTTELIAHFEKSFPRGPTIACDLRRPVSGRSVTVLFGPSGSGKSTILRALAGLERPETGSIRFGAEKWLDARTRVFVPPQRRGVGFLFQDYALFPHLNVMQNIGYALHGTHRNVRSAIVVGLMDRFGLEGLHGRLPRQISGGQQQRVALARALAGKPRLLLLDEPLASLDGPTRDRMRVELADMLARLEIPVFIVTHETREAVALGDYVVVLSAGRILQQGSVEEVFSHPANPEVARIVGVETVVRGRVLGVIDGLADIALGTTRLFALATPPPGAEVDVCIRAADVIVQARPAAGSSARNQLAGTVTRVLPEGATVRVEIDCGFTLTALLTSQAFAELRLAAGAPVTAIVKATAVHVVARR